MTRVFVILDDQATESQTAQAWVAEQLAKLTSCKPDLSKVGRLGIIQVDLPEDKIDDARRIAHVEDVEVEQTRRATKRSN